MAKIDLSKLRDVLKGLGFLRVYSVLLLPAVIVLAGVAVMTAAVLMGRSFKAKVESQSIPMGRQIKGLQSQADNSLVARQVDVEREYQDAYQEDVNLIESLAVQSTQRELLSYNIFPKPTDTSALLFTGFGASYRKGIEELITKVNARDCPSKEELKADELNKTPGAWMSGTDSRAGGTNIERITEQICQTRAKNASVYANPDDIPGYQFWKNYEYKDINTAVNDCCFWQLGYWIIQDVFDTVHKLNNGSNSVYDSPVKRIMQISFVSSNKTLTAKSGSTADSQKPRCVNKPEDQMTEACTARISNDDIDVVHFRVSVVVRATEILPFMKELCSAKEHRFAGYKGDEQAKVFKHNQITILESTNRPVDMRAKEHQTCRYGGDAVEQLDIICEYIFYKKGYEPINPYAAKKADAQSKAASD
jgi:hypothetical protein